jgi:hypothetical protein
MKKLLFSMLSLACMSLEATHFQSSMSVTPINSKNAFLIEMQIEKLLDESSTPTLIACPKIICVPGKPTQLTIESDDQADALSIQVMIPENLSQDSIRTSILMKEKDQVVLSFSNMIKVNN